ncbi:hypothetical protein [Polaromonas sp.]|uniref:hypothetical protein n=1 Tax=Polaromonas sp. TaxID=1869339 RepID=UPI0017BCA5E7|nr:hypothetical protein [Polaromonas sp.]NMM07408.1 hypothetical protein [Polaromonas sp.]
MTLGAETLELRVAGDDYGLSARRLWEHTELGQINVFGQAISTRQVSISPTAFIDVVRINRGIFSLAGFTLAEFIAGGPRTRRISADLTDASEIIGSPEVKAFVAMVEQHLNLCSIRQATRNQHHNFLPPAQTEDVFGVPFVFSTLRRRLQSMGKTKAAAQQWMSTIENFQKKGLRAAEIEHSNVTAELLDLNDTGEQATAAQMASLCIFARLRFSVIPVLNDAKRQLRFTSTPARNVKRAKKLPKAQAGQTRTAVEFDPILGYRIEEVEHQALWGPESHWQAVAHDGRVVSNERNQNLLFTAESAEALAANDAKLRFPKRLALGRWSSYAWTGGDEYREWLITLPHYPASYFSRHFNVRNVLAHVRCDLREGADGERVLLLQEIQSDWAQDARRAISAGDMRPDAAECPPFLKEWSALAMKLVLLHAAHQGYDAVAWTRGAHQVTRYKGVGATGLTELYDRTLPREVNRMIKPYGGLCEMLGVFVPANFSIKHSENGYEVYTPENELLWTAPTLEDARHFVPDGAHEQLYEVHGVRLSAEMRRGVLTAGFPAWG